MPTDKRRLPGPGAALLGVGLLVLYVFAAQDGVAKTWNKVKKTVSACLPGNFTRDWDAHPAVVEIKGFKGTLFALGDVHGAYEDVVNLLQQAKLVKMSGPGPTDFDWTGGDALLVQVGDLIDKGPRSYEALQFFVALEQKAHDGGGRVVVLAGNHELAFLAEPSGKKAKEFRREIVATGHDVCRDVYTAECPFGRWLRERPAAAVVNGIFFSHSGWTHSMTLAEISADYRNAADKGQWDSPFTCGDHAANPPTAGFFNANDWWTSSDDVDKALKAVGASQLAFGHDPHAFNANGEMVGYFGRPDGRALIKLDVGLWEHSGPAALLKCAKWRAGDTGCDSLERIRLPLGIGGVAVTEPLPVHAGPIKAAPDPEIRLGC